MEPRTGVGVGIDTRIIGGERFHLVEAVLDWIGFRFVAEMPLAGEVRRVTVLLEELGNRRSAFPEKVLVTGATTIESAERMGMRPVENEGRAAVQLAWPYQAGDIPPFLGQRT